MKKYLSAILVVVLGLVLVSCKPRYQPIINAKDFNPNWTFDASIDTSITFAHTMGKTTDPAHGQQALLDAQITAFVAEMKTAHGWNVKVTHSQYGGYAELLDKVGKELSTGNEPNMAYAYPDHVASYIASDKVLPLENLINNKDPKVALTKAEQDDYVESFLEEGRFYDHSGTTLSMPFSKSTEVMFYNKTFFAKHNIEVPKTWDDVKAVGKRIDEITDKPEGMRAFAYDSDDNLFIVKSAQMGLPYTELDENLQGKAVFNTPESQAMMTDLQKMYKDGYITTKGMIGGYTSDMFVSGKLAMTVGSTGGTNHNVPGDGSFEVGIAPMPQVNVEDPKVILQGPSIVLFRKGLRPKAEEGKWVEPKPTPAQINEMVASWMFYKFITRPENTIKQAMGTGYMPVRVSAFQDPAYLAYQATTHTNKEDLAKANVLKLAESLMLQDAFFASPAYPTSSKARKAVGELVMNAFGEKGTMDLNYRRAVAASS